MNNNSIKGPSIQLSKFQYTSSIRSDEQVKTLVTTTKETISMKLNYYDNSCVSTIATKIDESTQKLQGINDKFVYLEKVELHLKNHVENNWFNCFGDNLKKLDAHIKSNINNLNTNEEKKLNEREEKIEQDIRTQIYKEDKIGKRNFFDRSLIAIYHYINAIEKKDLQECVLTVKVIYKLQKEKVLDRGLYSPMLPMIEILQEELEQYSLKNIPKSDCAQLIETLNPINLKGENIAKCLGPLASEVIEDAYKILVETYNALPSTSTSSLLPKQMPKVNHMDRMLVKCKNAYKEIWGGSINIGTWLQDAV